jgi:hypothetical protein
VRARVTMTAPVTVTVTVQGHTGGSGRRGRGRSGGLRPSQCRPASGYLAVASLQVPGHWQATTAY